VPFSPPPPFSIFFAAASLWLINNDVPSFWLRLRFSYPCAAPAPKNTPRVIIFLPKYRDLTLSYYTPPLERSPLRKGQLSRCPPGRLVRTDPPRSIYQGPCFPVPRFLSVGAAFPICSSRSQTRNVSLPLEQVMLRGSSSSPPTFSSPPPLKDHFAVTSFRFGTTFYLRSRARYDLIPFVPCSSPILAGSR